MGGVSHIKNEITVALTFDYMVNLHILFVYALGLEECFI